MTARAYLATDGPPVQVRAHRQCLADGHHAIYAVYAGRPRVLIGHAQRGPDGWWSATDPDGRGVKTCISLAKAERALLRLTVERQARCETGA